MKTSESNLHVNRIRSGGWPSLALVVSILASLTNPASQAGIPDVDATLKLEAMKPKGEHYEATVPDTLDLLDRANLSINALSGNIEPATYYGVYQGFTFNKLPIKKAALTWNITPKNARSLPTLRSITGSDDNLDVEYGMMKALLSEIGEDGYLYYPFDGSGPPKGTSYPQINAITVFAMLNFYERDKNPLWLEWIDKVCNTLRETAIQVEDRAYYPMQSGIDREGNWHFMHHQGDLPMPYTPPDEPKADAQGLEGAAKSDSNRCMSALVKHYRLTGNKESLEMAKKICKFIMKPGMWEDTSDEGYPGHQQGIWSGHFHNGTQGLMALLDFAMATNDEHLKQVVRQGYDNAVRMGVVRIGFFPAWSKPWLYNRPRSLTEITEPCGVADMVCLGVMMSDAGLGDYWDDVDSIGRNLFIAQQLSNLEKFRKVSGALEGSEDDSKLKKFLGGFANGSPCSLGANDLPGCCTANGAQGIYYAWHGITRFTDGVATVNLFLNRASPWMDVDSYIPYEGKVVLHNKKAHSAMVRIPSWVERDKVTYFINEETADPADVGNYVLFQNLKPGDTLRLEFPIHESTSQYTIHEKLYTIHFKGNTVIDITPDETADNLYKYFPLNQYKADKAPMRKITRFAAEEAIPLGTF